VDKAIYFFVIVAAVAIVIQMAILFLIYKSMKESSTRMAAFTTRMEDRVTPVLSTAQAILVDAQPKVSDITANLAEATATMRVQVANISEATGEIVERARIQAARVDELISGTVERIELVQNTVITPVRRIQGIIQALQAGIGFLRHARAGHRKNLGGNPGGDDDEEMFI
jgi:uncharacterized protein YoxC